MWNVIFYIMMIALVLFLILGGCMFLYELVWRYSDNHPDNIFYRFLYRIDQLIDNYYPLIGFFVALGIVITFVRIIG